MSADRPIAMTELIAHLDTCGWSYGVRWTNPDADLVQLTVTGAPPWDVVFRIEATWLSRDGAPLKWRTAMTRQPYRGEAFNQSMKAVLAFVTPEPVAPR